MKTSGFLLYRLNFVDRDDLFQRPIANDSDFSEVLALAATHDYDVAKQGRRSGYRWALRAVTSSEVEEVSRPFINVTFSYEVTSRRGAIITDDGIALGTSIVSPPSATLVRVLIDLKRHIVAIEDVPSIIYPRGGWKTSLQTILDSAAWKLGFTSLIRLNPLVPSEVVESRLKTFDRITRLRVTLRIPNPDLGPSFQRLYDDMQRGGVRELSEDMRNERGLILAAETLPQAVLDMALRGYRKGKIHLYGYKGDEKDEITVNDDVARIEIGELREFVIGYATGQRSPALKRFAKLIISKIDEAIS